MKEEARNKRQSIDERASISTEYVLFNYAIKAWCVFTALHWEPNRGITVTISYVHKVHWQQPMTFLLIMKE